MLGPEALNTRSARLALCFLYNFFHTWAFLAACIACLCSAIFLSARFSLGKGEWYPAICRSQALLLMCSGAGIKNASRGFLIHPVQHISNHKNKM
jgi:hypothetical protein